VYSDVGQGIEYGHALYILKSEGGKKYIVTGWWGPRGQGYEAVPLPATPYVLHSLTMNGNLLLGERE